MSIHVVVINFLLRSYKISSTNCISMYSLQSRKIDLSGLKNVILKVVIVLKRSIIFVFFKIYNFYIGGKFVSTILITRESKRFTNIRNRPVFSRNLPRFRYTAGRK